VPAPDAHSCLAVRDLGLVPYDDAFALQQQLQAEVIAARGGAHPGAHPGAGAGVMHLLLLEHDPPVITISRRPGARRHLIATDHQLRDAGIQLAETNRGGDITYHGPGQLVAYPILDLNRLGLRIHEYMRLLEQIVIDLLARYNIHGVRDQGATGVWVAKTPEGEPTEGKICAMGVRVSKWVSMHGLALNVATNLKHFDHIVPCGLAGRSVTSMQQQLGKACPSMNEVKRAMAEMFTSAVETHAASAARV